VGINPVEGDPMSSHSAEEAVHRQSEGESKEEGNKAYLLFAVWFRRPQGAQRYREYLERASPIATDYGARRVDALLPIETLRGDFDPDYISVIEWPSIERYYEFLKDLRYLVVSRTLEEAVAKRYVIHCRRV
jgi:uncharacterized protein (DUF1330 family)